MDNEQEPLVTIFVEVLRHDEETGDDAILKKGTFKQPFPLTRIEPNTFVQWKIRHGHDGDKFRIEFQDGRSPFPDITQFDNTSKPQKATIRGRNFVYHVFVTDGKTGEVYQLDHSPILCTDP